MVNPARKRAFLGVAPKPSYGTVDQAQPSSSRRPTSSVYECDLIPRQGPGKLPFPPRKDLMRTPIPPPPPINALTAAFNGQQSVEARRQEALAKKRRKEIESTAGYKDMASGLARFTYKEPSERGGIEGWREDVSASVKVEKEGIKIKEEKETSQKRPRWAVDNPSYYGQPYQPGEGKEMGSGQENVKVEKIAAYEADKLDDDEDKDDLFDNILACKTKPQRKAKFLNDPIKPFQKIEPSSQAKLSSITRMPQPDRSSLTPHSRSNDSRSKFQQNSTPAKPLKIQSKSTISPWAIKAEAAEKKRTELSNRARIDREDDFEDDIFDQLLGAATAFDDGSDMFADDAFDKDLEAALAMGLDV